MAEQRKSADLDEREQLLLKDIEDTKAKHAFAQAEFEAERNELNDLVTKSKQLLQVSHLFNISRIVFNSWFLGENRRICPAKERLRSSYD